MLYLFAFICILYFSKYFLLAVYSRRQKKNFLKNQQNKKECNTETLEEIALAKDSFRKKLSRWLNGYVQHELMMLGKIPSQKYRQFVLKKVYGMGIAKNVVIYGDFEIMAPWNITIDENTIIGNLSKLDGRNGLHIGKNVNIGMGVWIFTNQHDVDNPYFACRGGVCMYRRLHLGCLPFNYTA